MEIAGLQGQARAVRNPSTIEAYTNFSYSRQMDFIEERRRVNQRAQEINTERHPVLMEPHADYGHEGGDYGNEEGDEEDHDMPEEHDGQ